MLSMTKRPTLHALFGERMVDGVLPSEAGKAPATMRLKRPPPGAAPAAPAKSKTGLAPPPKALF